MDTFFELLSQSGQRFPVGPVGLTIGRQNTNDIVISESRVSRLHARALIARERCWIRDENSKSGTFINGVQVRGQGEMTHGDVLQVGSARFNMVTQPAAAGAPAVVRSPGAARKKNLVWVGMGAAAVIVIVFLIAIFSSGGGNRTGLTGLTGEGGETTRAIPDPSGDVVTGVATGSSTGSVTLQLYDGTEADIAFISSTNHEPVPDVKTNYISDETGVTVIAVPQGDNYYPSIRFFPNLLTSNMTSKLAAPAELDMSAITMHMAPAHFDADEFYEETYGSLDHLEILPANMREWETRNMPREKLCEFAESLAYAHSAFAITHWIIEPASGTLHVGVLILEHIATEALCFVIATSPVDKYLMSVNSDLNLYLLTPDPDAMDYGFVLGQVLDDVTGDGIPGADLNADGNPQDNYNAESLSNGWYQLALPAGTHSINADALGYGPGNVRVETVNGRAVHSAPIALDPSADTRTLGVGDVKVTLRWYTEDDLDLHVIDPDFYEIYYRDPGSPSGGQLDRDSNAGCDDLTSSPVENIFWPEGEAPEGEYVITVKYFKECVSTGSVPFEVTVTVDGQTQTFDGQISDSGDSAVITRVRRH